MKTCFLQARVDEDDKEKAGEILKSLGTNYSAVISMLLKQIIATRGIPFSLHDNFADEKAQSSEKIREIMDAMSPGDTVSLAMNAKTPEEKYFYEKLGNYILQRCQEMAIEKNLF